MIETTAIDRDHSRVLRLDRRSSHQNLRDAVSELLVQLEATEDRQRRRRAPERERLRQTMEAMVADLYFAFCDDSSLALGYSRNKNDYDIPRRYRSVSATHTTVTLVADFLVASGYAEQLPGYYKRQDDKENAWANRVMRSRLRATAMLESFLWENHAVLAGQLSIARNGELVRLKDAEGNLTDYKDTPATRAMRKQLEGINDLLARTKINVPKADEGGNPELTATRLYRVFNDGRFDRGGRFYGAWWTTAKKRVRSHITINGEPTVELDYSAFHIRLCYHLSGLTPPDRHDLYDFEGTEGLRDAVKWAVNILLNLKPGMRMPRPKDEKISALLSGQCSTSKIRRLIERHYGEIGDWFGAGRGTELQFIDSEIAAAVLDRLTNDGIACLPVHDSFIVARSHQSLLHDVMMDTYSTSVSRITGQPSYPVIKT
jgi:hypothetical protein